MRQRLATRFLAGVALGAMLSILPGQATTAFAAAEAGSAKAAKKFDPAVVDTFAGAYLAARSADADRDFSNAVTFYKKALDFQPGDVQIRERLMLSHFMNGDFDEGVKYANDLKQDKAVERVTSISRGLDAIRSREYNAAAKILTYQGPNELDRLINSLLAAWTKVGAGKGKEAIGEINSLEGPPWYGIFKNYNAGVAAAVTGDVDTARKHLTEAVTDRNGAGVAIETFSRAVVALATLEAAQGNRQKALDAISAGDSVLREYAPFSALRNQISDGKIPEQVVRNATEGAAAVLFSIADALSRPPGGEDTVNLYLQFSAALDPKAADTQILLGETAERIGQSERAIAHYKRVPQSSPLSRISEKRLGIALAASGKMDEAREHLESLIEADPTDFRNYLALGGVLSEAKDYAAMASAYDKAVEVIGPRPKEEHWSIFYQRGVAYERLKEWDKAEPNFRKSLELSPDQPQVLNYLGYSWVDMNRNLDKGLDMIRRAVELRPDDGYIVDSLGWAYYRLNRFDEAVVEMERAVELKAADPTINDHLGDVYWRVGRKVEAVYQWQRALTYSPEATEIPKIEAKIANGLPPLDNAGETAEKPEKSQAETVEVDKKS